MIEEIKAYQTGDGKMHTSRLDAEVHEATNVIMAIGASDATDLGQHLSPTYLKYYIKEYGEQLFTSLRPLVAYIEEQRVITRGVVSVIDLDGDEVPL